MTPECIGNQLFLIPLPRSPERGDYDWYDIEERGIQVGKLRCRNGPRVCTVFSIGIYPEFQRNGYARAVISYLKTSHAAIVADRVRFTARDFWMRMGFIEEENGDFSWHRPS